MTASAHLNLAKLSTASLSNLYLIGLMGVGKTSVGRLLAKHFHRPFLDLDKEIERRTGVVVSTIFEIEGEEGFRRRESALIAELAEKAALSEQPPMVVATGGGAVLDPINRKNLQQSGIIIYLEAAPEMLFQRLRSDRSRPLLKVADPLERLRQLYQERDPLYREIASLTFKVGSGNVARQTEKLLAAIDSAQLNILAPQDHERETSNA